MPESSEIVIFLSFFMGFSLLFLLLAHFLLEYTYQLSARLTSRSADNGNATEIMFSRTAKQTVRSEDGESPYPDRACPTLWKMQVVRGGNTHHPAGDGAVSGIATHDVVKRPHGRLTRHGQEEPCWKLRAGKRYRSTLKRQEHVAHVPACF